MRLRSVPVCAFGLTLALSAAACGGGSEAPTSSAPASSAPGAAPSGQRVDPVTAATITGVVSLSAAAPANEAIRMNADPICLKQAPGTQTQETFVVGPDGKTLGNVFVYVKDGLGNYVFDAPAGPVVMDQQGCRYHPHVFGIRVNQPLEVVYSDHAHQLILVVNDLERGRAVAAEWMRHASMNRFSLSSAESHRFETSSR